MRRAWETKDEQPWVRSTRSHDLRAPRWRFVCHTKCHGKPPKGLGSRTSTTPLFIYLLIGQMESHWEGQYLKRLKQTFSE